MGLLGHLYQKSDRLAAFGRSRPGNQQWKYRQIRPGSVANATDPLFSKFGKPFDCLLHYPITWNLQLFFRILQMLSDGNSLRTMALAFSAPNTKLFFPQQLRFGRKSLRIMTPQTPKRAALQKNRYSRPRAIMDGKLFDIKYGTNHRRYSLLAIT